ncbi:MAG TPA: type ISP restriction/modification enzyme, partial [Pyrinomonadaceae bacterium]|nr:type ISP restriction/modification enzyme [Pyrinomonadaceae bacterium]
MQKLNLKPSQKHVRDYYEALAQFKSLRVSHETAVRSAFQTLLEACGRQFDWKLVPEWPIRRAAARSLRVDGVLHHPAYRERYAANLKRELPRIPFPPDFRAFVRAGE